MKKIPLNIRSSKYLSFTKDRMGVSLDYHLILARNMGDPAPVVIPEDFNRGSIPTKNTWGQVLDSHQHLCSNVSPTNTFEDRSVE